MKKPTKTHTKQIIYKRNIQDNKGINPTKIKINNNGTLILQAE